MTDSIRNLPRYIRQTDAFGWQGADSANGPWRSIAPPQSGTLWQTTIPMKELRLTSAEVSGVSVLSPAAQAVLAGFRAVPNLRDGPSIAGALRAAAKQCQIEWNYHPDYPETESVVVASDLFAIADELENTND